MQRKTQETIFNFINFLIPLDNAALKEIIVLAKQIQNSILSVLQSKYKNTLQENYEPNFFDAYITKSYQKIKIAKNLKLACESSLSSLDDVHTFIKSFFEFHNQTSKIELNLGNLELIHKRFSDDINSLNDKYSVINYNIQQINECMLIILRYMKAMIDLDSSNDPINQGFNFVQKKYLAQFASFEQSLLQKKYLEQIISFKESLVNIYQAIFLKVTDVKHQEAKEYATNQVSIFFEKLNSTLGKIPENLKSYFLDVQMLPYLMANVENDSKQKAVFQVLLHGSTAYLKLEEKKFLWKYYQNLINDYSSRLTYKETDKKKIWCLSTILERDIEPSKISSTAEACNHFMDKVSIAREKQEDEEIKQAMASVGLVYKPKNKPKNEEKMTFVDFTDPLHTNILIKNLNEVLHLTTNTTPEEICSLLDEILSKHLKNYLNPISFNNELYDILTFWKKYLSEWVARLKNEIRRAENLLQNPCTAEEHKDNDLTQEIINMIFTNTAEPKPELAKTEEFSEKRSLQCF